MDTAHQRALSCEESIAGLETGDGVIGVQSYMIGHRKWNSDNKQDRIMTSAERLTTEIFERASL